MARCYAPPPPVLSLFKYTGESSCSCSGPLQAGRQFVEHLVRGEWQDNCAYYGSFVKKEKNNHA